MSSKVWATYTRERPEAPWRLRSLASLSAERARALAEREQTRDGIPYAEFVVREFDSVRAVPWTLDT